MLKNWIVCFSLALPLIGFASEVSPQAKKLLNEPTLPKNLKTTGEGYRMGASCTDRNGKIVTQSDAGYADCIRDTGSGPYQTSPNAGQPVPIRR
jgi:hypothetical protein